MEARPLKRTLRGALQLIPFLLLIGLTAGARAADAPGGAAKAPSAGLEMRLWDGPAPNVPADAPPEVVGADGRVRNVSVPTLTAYLPAQKPAGATAIVMCSGGGYGQLNLPLYAKLGAEAFAPRGIVVFNLKYRLRPPSKDPRVDALADAERAVRIVRSRAPEWGINPDRIGLVGASAGANMLVNLVSHADAGQSDAPDPIERQSSRPNFVVLLSTWPGNQTIKDFTFAKETAIYVLHAEDDQTAKVEFAREVEAAARKAGAPTHAEYFPKGGHGAFGNLHNPAGPGDWTKSFLSWLEGQGLLAAAPAKP